MKLFVDDVRQCPDGWEKRTTITDAIKLLYLGVVDEISLDHDICHAAGFGEGSMCTCPEDYSCIANVIAMMTEDIPKKVWVHSANPWGRKKIMAILEQADVPCEERPMSHPMGEYCGLGEEP